jgi:ribonuclease D
MSEISNGKLNPEQVLRNSLLWIQGSLKPGALKQSRDGLDALAQIEAKLLTQGEALTAAQRVIEAAREVFADKAATTKASNTLDADAAGSAMDRLRAALASLSNSPTTEEEK